jgi:hypothetical protein
VLAKAKRTKLPERAVELVVMPESPGRGATLFCGGSGRWRHVRLPRGVERFGFDDGLGGCLAGGGSVATGGDAIASSCSGAATVVGGAIEFGQSSTLLLSRRRELSATPDS